MSDTDSMVERVAKAIGASLFASTHEQFSDEDLAEAARDAIEAMRQTLPRYELLVDEGGAGLAEDKRGEWISLEELDTALSNTTKETE